LARQPAGDGEFASRLYVFAVASEYGITTDIDVLPHVAARWPETAPDAPPLKVPISGVMVVEDRQQRTVLLFASSFELRYCIESNPHVRFHDTF
jgi:peptide subunit release factor RF-3